MYAGKNYANNNTDDATAMLHTDEAIDSTVEKFFSTQNLPKFKSLQNLNGSERRRIHPKLDPSDFVGAAHYPAQRPERLYNVVTDDLDYSTGTVALRMTQQITSTSTQDVRTTRYRKGSKGITRSRRVQLSVQEPSTSNAKHRYMGLPGLGSVDRIDDVPFNRADVKRKSTMKSFSNLFKRYFLGFSTKEKHSRNIIKVAPISEYQPPRTHGLHHEKGDEQHPLQRESSLRISVRPPTQPTTRQRSTSTGPHGVNKLFTKNLILPEPPEQVDSGMSRRRNDSVMASHRNKKSHLITSESAPESILRTDEIRNAYDHTYRIPNSGSSRNFNDDPESGLDSPTDSKSFVFPMPCMKGLPNLGNTCYMNSILQCLCAADNLSEYFVTNAFLNDLKAKPKNGESCDGVSIAFRKILEVLWGNEPSEQCIRDFRSAIALYNDVYATDFQQDAQELLDWLLDKLHEELNPPSAWESPVMSNATAVALRRKLHRSVVTDIFSASFRSSIECSNCYFKAVNFDPFMCVSLQVPEQEMAVFVTLSAVSRPKKLLCFGLKVKLEGRIFDVKDCARREFSINRGLLVIMETDVFGFTLLPCSTTIMTLNSDNVFALEIIPSRPDDITIIFTVVEVSGIAFKEHEQGLRVTEPLVCLVPRHATYEHICNSLFNAVKRCRPNCVDLKFPAIKSCRLVVFDKWKSSSTLDPCVSMPLYTQAVDDSLLELRDSCSKSSTQVLQLLFKTSDQPFLKALKNEAREIEYHSSYHALKELGASTTLTDCLREYTRPERLDWHCSMCGKNGGEKIMKFHSLPDVLVFHLKRFRRLRDGSMVKLARQIDFPVTGLDMSPFVYQQDDVDEEENRNGPSNFHYKTRVQVLPTEESQLFHRRMPNEAIFVDTSFANLYTYDLFAIVHHMGNSIDSGHYTATTKNPMDGKWRYYDDMIVRDINSPIDTETSTVYLLFYERRSAKKHMNCSSSGHSSTESGIQDHWFNRRNVDVSHKTKWCAPRSTLTASQDCNGSNASKDVSPLIGVRSDKSKDVPPLIGVRSDKSKDVPPLIGVRSDKSKDVPPLIGVRSDKSKDVPPLIGVRSDKSKDVSPTANFRRNEVTRSAHSPAYYTGRTQNHKSGKRMRRLSLILTISLLFGLYAIFLAPQIYVSHYRC